MFCGRSVASRRLYSARISEGQRVHAALAIRRVIRQGTTRVDPSRKLASSAGRASAGSPTKSATPWILRISVMPTASQVGSASRLSISGRRQRCEQNLLTDPPSSKAAGRSPTGLLPAGSHPARPTDTSTTSEKSTPRALDVQLFRSTCSSRRDAPSGQESMGAAPWRGSAADGT